MLVPICIDIRVHYFNIELKIARSRRRARDIHSRTVQGLAIADSSVH